MKQTYSNWGNQVEYIEEDAIVSIKAFVKQSGATWGLGRISHKKKGSTIYQYDDSAGVDTCAYVVDTGVEAAHRVCAWTVYANVDRFD